MSGTWSKLKKSMSVKSYATAASSENPTYMSEHSVYRSVTSQSPSSVTSSSSLFSRFSRSFTSTVPSFEKSCAICLGNLRSGQGQAIFIAECSHSFHFSCISNSVKHGNHLCPICRFKWKEIPVQLNNATRNQAPLNGSRQTPGNEQPHQYSDDEPLLVSMDPTPSASRATSNNVSIKAFTEFPVIAALECISNFAVLVGVRAPPLSSNAHQIERAPIDLVTVLDVSGSMVGSKLILLKRAVCFVIDNLGPADRLSIVSFSVSASRIFPLRRMTDSGREDAKRAVNSLCANGGTSILNGIRTGAQVLEQRRERNPIGTIILLSDGKNTPPITQVSSKNTRFLNLLPVSIRSHNTEQHNHDQQTTFSVHTFGFGTDHDSSVMHAISDASGGTFSFIESIDKVQDAFARCIGGLLSVVAQELRLTVTSAEHGVKICLIPSGTYFSEICEQGLQGVINVGNLYADEDKEFLIYLTVPKCFTVEEQEGKTLLLNMECCYKDNSLKEIVQLKLIEIRRPEILSPSDMILSLEVDRQKNRIRVVESIAKAREMAERGNLEVAQAVLTNMRSDLISTASAQAGDGLCSWLEAELVEIRDRMVNMAMYEETGRAYVLSGLSSHSWQRSTTRGDSTTQMSEGGSSSRIGYDTPSMVTMVSKSQNMSFSYQTSQVQMRDSKNLS